MATRNRFLLACVGGVAVLVTTTFAGTPPKTAPDEAAQQLASLLKERRDTLQRMVDVLAAQHKSGAATFDAVVLALDRLCDAEIELATTSADRIAAYEKKVANLLANEKYLELKFRAGHTTEIVVLDAKATRLKAEIQLLRERAPETSRSRQS